MSGDLLEDLMSSEGEFAYRHTDGEADDNYCEELNMYN